ncbi:hypothetical protein GCM10023153_08110 [Ornithinibacter aureus]|uniref:Uncharacterized protein n=1 Tax=Ornithinibacter aureus TaxID=622664 RepID=A0ABP8JH25_9MICO|nr:hypothetical protein [Ornithinibacter aureus]KAF0833205.1 hypothetical protein C8E84_0983 [Ornithinibacter aureus]
MTAWEGLDHEVPLLLVPVRLETQTEAMPADAPPDAPVRLRVRIYPDDVGLDHDTGTALLLPDAFVVVARVGGDVVAVEQGEPVSLDHLGLGRSEGTAPEHLDDLAASLRALARHDTAEGAAAAGAEGAAVSGAEWLWSYEAALEVGMAVTLTLPPGTERLDSLVVMGARTGRDPDEESAAVTAALLAHGDDCGFLRAGDPTNNTEQGRSAWARPDAGAGESVEPDPAALTATSAATLLAEAFGAPDAPLAHWVGAGDDGQAWAHAMATVLWPVTGGTFLTRSVRPGALDPGRIDALRGHHRAAVRGRGPLPLLRIGRQPYGVLPVTVLAQATGVSPAVDALARVLERTAVLWRLGARSVPAVPRDGIRALPGILGQTPVSWGLRVRRLLGTGGPLAAAVAATSLEQAQARGDLTAVFESLMGVRQGTLADPDVLGVDRTLGLPLVADDDPEVLAALAEGGDPGESSVLQVLLGLAHERVRTDLDRRLAGPRVDGEVDRYRRARELRDALDGRLLEAIGADAANAAREVLEAVLGDDDRDDLADLAEHTLHLIDRGVEEQGVVTRWARPLGTLDASFAPPTTEGLVTDLDALLRALVLWRHVRDALRTLARVSDPADRRGLLAESLDCTSHRHDAWVTSIATARLAQLRAQRRTGITVGAFGLVEDLVLVRRHRPADPETPDTQPAERGGVVHAPSLRHASTAAVLRSARLAHAPDDEADRALEMDLSSTRAREAREVLAGMRSGQELGALLGYRFERWLTDTDASLGRFVAPLRALAPSIAAKEVDRVAEGIVDVGVEVLATSQVVDGVRLLDLDRASVRERLRQRPPALARYDAPWPPIDEEWGRVSATLDRLGGLLDAVGDLLLAEGVHQVVAGNPAGAAAAMDALSGDGLPADPDVIANPHDRSGLSHRLVVLLPHSPGAGATDGWSATPRARANPRLESWCRLVLGPAHRIVVTADGSTLRALDVGALDVVEAAGAGSLGLTTFWARARLTRPRLPAEPLTQRPPTLAAGKVTLGGAWQLAGALRRVLVSARALEAADVVHDPRDERVVRAAPAVPGPGDPWRDDLHALLATLAAIVAEAPPAVASPGASPGTIRRLAARLAEFGLVDGVVPEGVADPDDGGSPGAPADDLLLRAQVAAALTQAEARVDEVTDLLGAAATVADVVTAAGLLTGSELPVPLPLDPAPTPEPLTTAWEADDASQQHGIRAWLARHARVRSGVQGYTEVAMLRAAARRRAPLRAVTLDRPAWLGEHLPDAVAPASAHTSLVVESAPGVHPVGGYSGLVVDAWHETLPRRREVPDDTTSATGAEDAPPEEVATTGLAVHANGPDARAPQVLLLAVTPDRMPWSQERVLAIVDETRALARQRLVTLERLPLAGSLLPAATVSHWSLHGERVLDPRLLSELADLSTTPRFVRFDG